MPVPGFVHPSLSLLIYIPMSDLHPRLTACTYWNHLQKRLSHFHLLGSYEVIYLKKTLMLIDGPHERPTVLSATIGRGAYKRAIRGCRERAQCVSQTRRPVKASTWMPNQDTGTNLPWHQDHLVIIVAFLAVRIDIDCFYSCSQSFNGARWPRKAISSQSFAEKSYRSLTNWTKA